MSAWTIVQALHCQAYSHLPMVLHALRALMLLTSVLLQTDAVLVGPKDEFNSS